MIIDTLPENTADVVDRNGSFKPISEDQMAADIQMSEEQIRQGRYKPFDESMSGIRERLGL